MMSKPGKMKRSDIIEIIGICLIITALISTYGIYYTSNEYAKVTETQMNINAVVPYYPQSVSMFMADNTSTINVNIAVLNNVSRIDVEIYLIEYTIYASDEPIHLPDYNDYIGIVAFSGSGNEIVPAGENQIYNVPIVIDSDNEYYPKLQDITLDGSAYLLIQGRVHYKLTGASGLQDSIIFYYINEVGVNAR